MLDMLSRVVNAAINDPHLDPTKIPAKIELEGLGTIPYSVDSIDFRGKKTRILPNDPERTFKYVLASSNQPTRDDHVSCIKKGEVAAAMLGVMFCTAMFAIAVSIGSIVGICSSVLLAIFIAVGVLGQRDDRAEPYPV